MAFSLAENWPRTVAEARAVQDRLRDLVQAEDRFGRLTTVAGVDVHFPTEGTEARAVAVLFSYPGLELQETALAETRLSFPYVSGYLSFREVPAALAALAGLSRPAGVVLADGQGRAHPRRFGLACHLGLLLDRPTIGVAKTRLVGSFEPPGEDKGEWSPLVQGKEEVGAVVRTRTGVRPVFVSPGHKVGLRSAIRLTLACTTRFRLPEPLRLAHGLAKKAAQGINR